MVVDVKSSLYACNTIYKCYENLINSYVADFYLENHWDKFPNKWRSVLESSEVEDIEKILKCSQPLPQKVYPLSLMCLRIVINIYSISRKSIDVSTIKGTMPEMLNGSKFIKFFWRGVKLKKRHEVAAMSQVCYKAATRTNCFCIVDIGSGLGHLSRLLSYGFGFNVVSFECNSELCTLAQEIDAHFEKMLDIKGVGHKRSAKTVHVNKKIEFSICKENFLNLIKKAFNTNDTNFKFGIVGLHPCGDLGATLLRLYKDCPNAVFINIVSCCYMKLSLDLPNPCFPLSNFCKENSFKLDYLSCELACHAIETYIERISVKEYQKLKIHAFRAGLEYVLVKLNPDLKHSPVCNFKYNKNLTFHDYCAKTLHKYNLEAPLDEIVALEKIINESWKKVVLFFSMRLLLAPLIETILLYDRFLYIQESSNYCDVIPVFESTISPRNHVLSATKIDHQYC